MSIFERMPWLKKASIAGGLALSAAMVGFMFIGTDKEEVQQVELPLSTQPQNQGSGSLNPYSPENKPEIWERTPPIYKPTARPQEATENSNISDMREGVGFTICAIATPWDKISGSLAPIEFIASESVFWFGNGNPPLEAENGKPVSFGLQDLNDDGVLQHSETESFGEFMADPDSNILAFKRSDGSWISFTSAPFTFADFGKGREGDLISGMRNNGSDWEIDLNTLDSGC